MRRRTVILALALALAFGAGPALAAVPPATTKPEAKKPEAATPKPRPSYKLGSPGRPITAVVKTPTSTATFAFVVPDVAPLFTCPMHPEQVSDKAEPPCSVCDMKLVPRTHSLRVAFSDKEGELVPTKGCYVEVTDQHGLTQRLKMAGKNPFQGSFALEKGKLAIVAMVTPTKGKGYTVKTSVKL